MSGQLVSSFGAAYSSFLPEAARLSPLPTGLHLTFISRYRWLAPRPLLYAVFTTSRRQYVLKARSSQYSSRSEAGAVLTPCTGLKCLSNISFASSGPEETAAKTAVKSLSQSFLCVYHS